MPPSSAETNPSDVTRCHVDSTTSEDYLFTDSTLANPIRVSLPTAAMRTIQSSKISERGSARTIAGTSSEPIPPRTLSRMEPLTPGILTIDDLHRRYCATPIAELPKSSPEKLTCPKFQRGNMSGCLFLTKLTLDIRRNIYSHVWSKPNFESQKTYAIFILKRLGSARRYKNDLKMKFLTDDPLHALAPWVLKHQDKQARAQLLYTCKQIRREAFLQYWHTIDFNPTRLWSLVKHLVNPTDLSLGFLQDLPHEHLVNMRHLVLDCDAMFPAPIRPSRPPRAALYGTDRFKTMRLESLRLRVEVHYEHEFGHYYCEGGYGATFETPLHYYHEKFWEMAGNLPNVKTFKMSIERKTWCSPEEEDEWPDPCSYNFCVEGLIFTQDYDDVLLCWSVTKSDWRLTEDGHTITSKAVQKTFQSTQDRPNVSQNQPPATHSRTPSSKESTVSPLDSPTPLDPTRFPTLKPTRLSTVDHQEPDSLDEIYKPLNPTILHALYDCTTHDNVPENSTSHPAQRPSKPPAISAAKHQIHTHEDNTPSTPPTHPSHLSAKSSTAGSASRRNGSTPSFPTPSTTSPPQTQHATRHSTSPPSNPPTPNHSSTTKLPLAIVNGEDLSPFRGAFQFTRVHSRPLTRRHSTSGPVTFPLPRPRHRQPWRRPSP